MLGAALLITLFSFFSVPVFRPWVSWASVHSQFSVIDVVRNSDETKGIQLQWWGVLALSVVYILLSFTLGEEARDAFKWARSLIQKRPLRRPFILANHRLKTPEPRQMSTRSPTAQPRPLTIELSSGWDDTLDFKVASTWGSSKKSKSVGNSSRYSPSPSPTAASTASGDEVFMASTLSYLGSPPAQSLGIASPRNPIQAPSPTYAVPRRAIDLSPPSPVKRTPSIPFNQVQVTSVPPSTASKEKHKSSAIASALEVNWPVPPVSPVPSVPSRHGSLMTSPSCYSTSRSTSPQSRSDSPALPEDEIDDHGYPPSLFIPPPFHMMTRNPRPLEGSSISSMSDIGASSTPTVGASSRSWDLSLKRGPSLRSLQSRFSREQIGQGYFPSNDVIHMTVVQETV